MLEEEVDERFVRQIEDFVDFIAPNGVTFADDVEPLTEVLFVEDVGDVLLLTEVLDEVLIKDLLLLLVGVKEEEEGLEEEEEEIRL